MRSLVAVGVVAVGLLAALLGWMWTGEGRTLDAGGTTVLVSARTSSGMDAAIGGELAVVGGCLGVDDAVIVWPHGTEVVDDDPLTVDVPGHGRIALGDDVTMLGGGFVHEPPHDPVGGEVSTGGVRVPAECAGHPVALTHDG